MCGWPLLTVETEVNGDSKSTNERALLWLFFGLIMPVQEAFILPWLFYGQHRTKYFFLTANYFNSCVTQLPSNLGRQSFRAACL